MRFLKPFRSQKFIIELWLEDTLNSPIKIKFSKLLLCSSIRRFKHSRWFEIKFWWGLYEQLRGHFLFLKLTSTERVSMLHFDLLINNLDFISSRMYRRSPPPFPFLSYLYETLKPFIWNWAEGKESSSFVSDIRSKLILLSIMYVSASNLFLTELILRWPDINISGDWILIFLGSFFIINIIFCRRSMKDSQFWNWHTYLRCLSPYVLGYS